MISSNLTERDKCRRCGTLTLERDAEGDIHCWGCGTTFFPGSVHPGGGQSSGNGVARHPKVTSVVTSVVTSEVTSVGHHPKVVSKVPQVVDLYNSEYGVRFIARDLSMAVSTARVIVKENGHLIDYLVAEKRRKDRVRRHKQSIIPALKGLASTAKRNRYSHKQLLRRVRRLLSVYMERDPQGTTASLSGNGSHSAVDDMVRRACEVVMVQGAWLDGRANVRS